MSAREEFINEQFGVRSMIGPLSREATEQFLDRIEAEASHNSLLEWTDSQLVKRVEESGAQVLALREALALFRRDVIAVKKDYHPNALTNWGEVNVSLTRAEAVLANTAEAAAEAEARLLAPLAGVIVRLADGYDSSRGQTVGFMVGRVIATFEQEADGIAKARALLDTERS